MSAQQVDLAIVGAGPAGVSAALEAARRGLKPLVLDEQARPGGRMVAQVHEDPTKKGQWLNGQAIINDLIDQARAAGVEFRFQAEVWGLWPSWKLTVGGPGSKAANASQEVTAPGQGAADTIEAKSVLIATGAAQNGLPFSGWTLPGMISAGAVQTMMHQHRVLPGRRVLVVGTDPLALAAASELTLFGAKVVGVVLPPPGPATGSLAQPKEAIAGVARLANLAPNAALRAAGSIFKRAAGIGASLFPKEGFKVGDVPMMFRRCIVRAEGQTAVEAAVLSDLTASGHVVAGTEERIPVDAICISGGLYPLAELIEASGEGKFAHIEELGGRVPLHGLDMQTTAPGLFVAGSATGVEGAQVAMAQGRVAGIGATAYLGRITQKEADQLLAEAAAGVETARKEAWLAFHPDVEKGRERISKLRREKKYAD